MLKAPVRLVLIINVLLLLSLGLGLALGFFIYKSHTSYAVPTKHTTKAQLTTVTIPPSQDLFEPFILPVPLHTTVTWKNNDTVTHLFTTTPDQLTFLNPQVFSFTVPAGKSVNFTFTHAGLYHYYEKNLSTWNTRFARVAARKGVPHYPLAMDGVIWVEGPISHLPDATLNQVPLKHDELAYEFVAINQFGSVTWHNFDTDPHFIGLVPGWTTPINPTRIGLYRISGTNDVLGGASATVIFNKPGLYYYYCRSHDHFDPSSYRALAVTTASEYPLPMDGFVLVVGNS
jgi:plastocyanin